MSRANGSELKLDKADGAGHGAFTPYPFSYLHIPTETTTTTAKGKTTITTRIGPILVAFVVFGRRFKARNESNGD